MRDQAIKIDHVWLKNQMDNAGIRPDDMAFKMGFSPQMMSMVLAGKLALPNKKWIGLAKILEIEWQNLKFKTGVKKNGKRD